MAASRQPGRRGAAAACLAAAAGFAPWGGCGPHLARAEPQELHVVDVLAVVCPGQAGQADVYLTPQPGKEGLPHIISIYRNGKSSAAFRFSLEDDAGVSIFNESDKDVGLASYDARRLEEVYEAIWTPSMADGCDDLFLLDGRQPVALPDTWAEARDAMLSVCLSEGQEKARCAEGVQEVFRGYPDGDGPFRSESGFCTRFQQQLQLWMPGFALGIALPRRMKGRGAGTASGGKAAHVGGYKSGRVNGGYSHSKSGLAASYPAGHRSTSYGYTGMGSRAPLYGGVGVYSMMFWGPRPYTSRASTRCAEDSASCNSNGDNECESGKRCKWHQKDGEVLIRDDLMEFGLIPSNYRSPLKFTVSHLNGSHYGADQICPPSGWDPKNNSGNWTPQQGGDIFVALSDVEMVEDENPPWWVIMLIVLGVVIPFCCCSCIFCHIVQRKKKQSEPFTYQDGVTPVQAARLSNASWHSETVQRPVVAGIVLGAPGATSLPGVVDGIKPRPSQKE